MPCWTRRNLKSGNLPPLNRRELHSASNTKRAISIVRTVWTNASAECARFALVWRPKFLAALSLTRSVILSARAAHVHKDTAYAHRKQDEEFAQQWQEAEADAIELLHALAFQRALEGDCEPILYMGLTVGYVRKYDSRLQIEMLRAHKPDTFKTAGVQVNIGQQNVFRLTEDQRHRLMDYNRQWLRDTPVDEPASQLVTPRSEGLTQ